MSGTPPLLRRLAVCRCPRCKAVVEVYGQLIGAWCGTCDVPLSIVSEVEWAAIISPSGNRRVKEAVR